MQRHSQVRSLESTIHGLEHTIAVGHGAGMEELTEAYMRSEVTKLQQEMDQLVHGTPVSQVFLIQTFHFTVTASSLVRTNLPPGHS